MSKVITVQRYDNNIQLFFHITNNGVIEPIPGAKVYLRLKHRETGQQYERQVEIVDAELAECRYVLTREDLETVGTYDTEVETHYFNGTVLSTLDSPITLVVTPEIVDQDGRFKENSAYRRERQQAIEQPRRKEQPSVIQFL